uniref:GP-PDE domain-containing protein n=1 Tax=Stomoxys calcitrans TaxID=35570 RepID=A0A1I8P9C0_STOCA
MHRWFFADEEIIRKEPTPIPTLASPTPTTSLSSVISESLWKFTVKYDGKLCYNEIVALSGSIEALGSWQLQQCVLLTLLEDLNCPGLWTASISLPRKDDIRYRYLICAHNGRGHRIVRFWEAHKGGRVIRREDEQEHEAMSFDVFGMQNGIYQIERGWIGLHAVGVQFKLHGNPFHMKTHELKDATYLYCVKLSPMKIKTRSDCGNGKMSRLVYSDSKVQQKEDPSSRASFAFCEVASMGPKGNGEFRSQSKYGTPCDPQEILMFHLTLDDLPNTAYLIELYTIPQKAAEDIPPYHIGYQYVLPQYLHGAEGNLHMTILCATKHRPIGALSLDYLLIKPLPGYEFLLNDSQQRECKRQHQVLDIGHRGCGKSFWCKDNILRENTLHSFQKAVEHGADMIEFDVQLTQDRVPIVYHDFQLYIVNKDELSKKEYDVMKLFLHKKEISVVNSYVKVLKSGVKVLPVNKLSLQQLQQVEVYHNPKENQRFKACLEDKNLSLPFPMLKEILKKMPPTLPFLVEIKWPQRFTNKEWEEHFKPDMDKNEFVDTILQEVFTNAGDSRPIIFSSFDANICSLIRFKQNRYPVVFICHSTDSDAAYLDPLGDTLVNATNFVTALQLWGIVADADAILKSARYVVDMRNRNIRFFASGSSTRDEKIRRSLKAIGVDGIIFDRINHVLNVDDLKQNIFVIDVRE